MSYGVTFGQNVAPKLAKIGDKSVKPGTELKFTLSAKDADGDDLTYTVSGNPSGSKLSGKIFNWTPTSSQVGSYGVTFTVSDGKGGKVSETMKIVVTDPPKNNSPDPAFSDANTSTSDEKNVENSPIFDSIGDKSAVVGEQLGFTLAANSVSGKDLIYSVSGSPPGALLSGKKFSWEPDRNQVGRYNVTFIVSEIGGNSSYETISIKVDPSPAIIEFEQTQLSFGNVEVGKSKSLDLVFNNTGGASITSLSFSYAGKLRNHIESEVDRLTVPGYGSSGVSFTYKPTSVSALDVIVYFTFGNQNFEVKLLGNGVDVSMQDSLDDLLESPVVMDLDDTSGNQGLVEKTVKKDDELLLELYYDGVKFINGFGVKIEYDTQLLNIDPSSYAVENNTVGNLIPVSRSIETGIVEVGFVTLDEEVATGHGLGSLIIEIKEKLTSPTQIKISEISLKIPGSSEEIIQVNEVVKLIPAKELLGDFDGDGTVSFTDFFMFADAFGNPDADSVYDLNESGFIDFSDFFLFADMFGKSDRAKLIALEEKHLGLPQYVTLETNYPNPFNSWTELRYSLQDPSELTLAIYDLSGQIIKKLVHGYHQAGSHNLTWDGTNNRGQNVSTGIYIVRLYAHGRSLTRKITLIK